jgi:site-specific DNA-methyltransferase (adenine-specific)
MTTPHYADDAVTVYHGDCLNILTTLPEHSVDAVVTDPPYLLGFMGREWDTRAAHEHLNWHRAWVDQCLRVLKPGGHLLAFGGTRTWHRLAAAIEDAGFEIRDSVAWLYGSGFPKSLDVSKAIDKQAGAERAVILPRTMVQGGGSSLQLRIGERREVSADITAPATDAAKQWQGWGTALKPAFEPIVVARKPLRGTVAGNVLEFGTGALNIDQCRVGTDDKLARPYNDASNDVYGKYQRFGNPHEPAGRWPSNVLLDQHTAAELDKQSGTTRDKPHARGGTSPNPMSWQQQRADTDKVFGVADEGGASRFFPTFKTQEQQCTTTTASFTNSATAAEPASKSTTPRTPAAGGSTITPPAIPTFKYTPKAPTDERPSADGIAHPTVKPLDLMRWLVRLVTPPHGLVLDPFAGTGTTGEAAIHEHCHAILIERETSYLPLIVGRLRKPMQVGFDFSQNDEVIA